MKDHSEQDVSAHSAGLTAFFEGLASKTNLTASFHSADLQAFFTGLGPGRPYSPARAGRT